MTCDEHEMFFRYDATVFVQGIIDDAAKLKQRRKSPREIRWYSYCKWAYSLKFKNIGPPNAQYGYPAAVLDFIREVTPGDIKGEHRDDAHLVTLKEFCQALDMPGV